MHRAWWLLALTTMMLFTLGGARNSFAVLYKPITEDTGWSRGALAGAVTVGQLAIGLSFLAAGMAVDRYGPRRVVPVFALLQLGGYLLASRASTLWEFYVGWGVLAGVGFGIGVGPLMSIIARWFQRHRGLALGIASSAPHAGVIVFSPVTSLLVDGVGWRWTFVVMGVIPFISLVVAARFLHRWPQEAGVLPYGAVNPSPVTGSSEVLSPLVPGRGATIREALRRRELWLLCFIYGGVSISTGLVLYHLVNYSTDEGLSPLTAAALLSVLSGASVAGRLGVGIFADQARLGRLLTFSVGLMAVSVGLLAVLSEPAGFYSLAAAFGLFLGGAVVLQTIVTRAIFGEQSLGAVLGIVLLSINIGTALGALLGGVMYDWTGSYTAAFLVAGGAAALAAVGAVKVRV